MELDAGHPVCPQCGWQRDAPPQSPLHLRPGSVLQEQYLIGRVLGHGGFGVTYLAWDLNLARRLAVKEYLPQGVATRSTGVPMVIPYSGPAQQDFEYGLEKFLEEARVLARFQNFPSITSVLNFFRANGTAYLVMEYLDGVTLEGLLARQGGSIPYAEARRIIMPIMEALREVHASGILHRDISPDNIVITRTGQVKLLDFGAARYALSQQSRNLSIILKEGYAPEEQYRTKGRQGPWTDVYAVGATLYRAVTGRVPPPALDRLESDDLQRPRVLDAQIAEADEAILLKALAVRAADRFQSIEDFQTAMSGPAAATDPGVILRPLPPPGPVVPPEPVLSPRPALASVPRWAWGAAVVAAAAILALVMLPTNDGAKRPNPSPPSAGPPSGGVPRASGSPPGAASPPPGSSGAPAAPRSPSVGPTLSAPADPQVPPPGAVIPPSATMSPSPKTLRPPSPGTAGAPSEQSYAELIGQATDLLRRRRLGDAEAVLAQAIRREPSQPQAYELSAQARLAVSDLAGAAEHLRRALSLGGTATFPVKQDRSDGKFTAVSRGTLRLSRARVTFAADDGGRRFDVPWSDVREFKKISASEMQALDEVVRGLKRSAEQFSEEVGKIFGGGGSRGRRPGDAPGAGAGDGAFLVTLARGEHYLFAPAGRLGDEERTLIVSLANELTRQR